MNKDELYKTCLTFLDDKKNMNNAIEALRFELDKWPFSQEDLNEFLFELEGIKREEINGLKSSKRRLIVYLLAVFIFGLWTLSSAIILMEEGKWIVPGILVLIPLFKIVQMKNRSSFEIEKEKRRRQLRFELRSMFENE